MTTVPAVQPSVFDEEIELPPEEDAPRVSRVDMIDRFARLLGRSDLPQSEWRAVGEFEALDETVRSTVQWMTDALTYRRQVGPLPEIPHETITLEASKTRVRRPAHGTKSVFDACVDGLRGGLSPAQIQSSWNTAKRQVLRSTRGIGGLRGGQR